MNSMTITLLVTFWAMQIIAQLFFKHGSASPGRWLTGFILGNVFGASSIWLLMKLYQRMDPNTALALGSAGGFLGAQLFLALVFHARPTVLQWTGFVAVAVGMALATAGVAKPVAEPVVAAQIQQ